MKPGLLVTLEGGEGAGKSTGMETLRSMLSMAGIPALLTREPGGTALGEQLRGILLTSKDPISDDAELLMMFAARAQHLHERIEPALQRGEWVLCDRFTDSTYAYQGWGRGVSPAHISALEQWVQGDRRPDRTLLFDIPVEQGLERARKRADLDRFEREKLDFLQRVREGFLALAKQHPRRIAVISAGQPLDEVNAQLETVIHPMIDAWKS